MHLVKVQKYYSNKYLRFNFEVSKEPFKRTFQKREKVKIVGSGIFIYFPELFQGSLATRENAYITNLLFKSYFQRTML